MANLILRNRQNAQWFVPDAATQVQDVIFEVDGLASGAGHQSASLVLGEGAVAGWYEWRAFLQFATPPVLDEAIRIYLKTMGNDISATSHPDNDDGTGDAAVSAENKLKNLQQIGAIVVVEAAADVEMVRSGRIYIVAHAVQVVWWNGTLDALTTDVNENGFLLAAVPEELQ